MRTFTNHFKQMLLILMVLSIQGLMAQKNVSADRAPQKAVQKPAGMENEAPEAFQSIPLHSFSKAPELLKLSSFTTFSKEQLVTLEKQGISSDLLKDKDYLTKALQILGYSNGIQQKVTFPMPDGTKDVVAPYTQAFETWPPDQWDLTGGTYSWQQYTATGLSCAYANFWGQTSGNTDVMTSPTIDVSGLTSAVLQFDWSHLYNTSYPTDALTVSVSGDNGSTWTDVWTKSGVDFDSNDGAGNTTPGTFVSTDLIDISSFGDNIKIKFYGYSGYGPDCYVDNVVVADAPPCPQPVDLGTSGITTNGANLIWTSYSGLSDIEIVLAGAPPTGIPTYAGVTSPYEVTGLTASTAYSFYVRDVCGGGDYSWWSGPYSFATSCDVFPAPFLEEFTNWPPLCWDLTGGTYSWVQYTTGVQCAMANFWGQTSGNTDIMTTPLIDISGANYGLEFDWSHLYSTTYPTDAMEVLVSDDYGVNWTSVWYKAGPDFESNDGAGTTTPGSFVSSDVIGLAQFNSPIMIRFYGYSGYGPDVFIDNVNVFEVAYGNLAGTVTKLSDNTPVEGAVISLGPLLTATTGIDGTYTISGVLVGDYTATCSATGYNPANAAVTIVEDQTTSQDFAITAPTMEIDPLSITVVLDPAETTTETITISNNGNGPLGWNGQLQPIDGKNSGGNSLKGSQALALDLFNAELVSFDVDIPGTFTNVGPMSLSLFAGDFDNVNTDFFYALDYDSNGLYTIDVATGTATYIGPLTGIIAGQSIAGMACDKATGVMYVSTTDITNSDIYTIDLTSGALTHIGTTGIPGLIEIAIDGMGTMYGWDIVNDQSFTIDKSTGASTLLGSLGYDLNYAQGGNWDPVSDNIYVAAYSTMGQLMTLDKTTGALVYIGDLQGGAEVDALAFPGSANNWISIDPHSGTIDPANSDQMTVSFDAGDIIPGTIKHANINFSSNPAVGTVTVPVTMVVGSLAFGYITGNVSFDGIDPYNFGNILDVLVEAGPYYTHPDINGDYSLMAYPGTYDLTATLYGYTQQMSPGVVVGEGATIPGMDFVMPCIYGRIMGTVIDDLSGDPLEGATIDIEGSGITATTASDGTYVTFVEAGTYNVTAFDETHTPVTEPDVVIPVQGDVTVDYSLQPSLAIVYPSNADYWTGTTTQTEKTQVSLMNVLSNGGEQAWAKFDISSVPEGAVVTSISLNWYINTTNCPYQHINALPVDPVTADPATLYSAITGGELYTDYSTCPVVGWNTLVLGGNANADLSEAIANGWFAISFHEYETAGTYAFSADGWNEPNEPYLVINFFIPTFGVLNGTVTETATGNPVEGAQITAAGPYYNYYFTTGADGMYSFDPCATGTYTITCNAPGYNIETATVDVFEGQTTTQDFSITAPQFILDPMSISIEIEPNAMDDEYVSITNPGNGPLNWGAQVQILSDNANGTDKAKGSQAYALDLINASIVSMDVDVPGTFTTIGANSLSLFAGDFDNVNTSFYYALNYDDNGLYTIDVATGAGTYVGPLTGIIGGQSIAGMACDKSTGVMYVSTTDITSSDIYTIDLNTGALTHIGTTGIPGLIEIAIDGTGTMYGWDIVNDQSFIIDKSTGASTLLGPLGVDLNYAQGGNWDPVSDIIYVAAYSSSGQLMTLDKTTGALTMVGAFSGGSEVDAFAFPGGFSTWISIDPHSGTIEGGNNDQMNVHFDATDMIPGVYQAEIHFTTTPNVGSPVIDVTMTVAGLIPATNVNLSYTCTDVNITWDMPAGGTPDSWNVYKDGALLANVTAMSCPDPMVDPGVEIGYYVKAVYAGEESQPTVTKYITVPTPANLQPLGLDAAASGSTVVLSWNVPNACLAPDGYNVFRDGVQVNTALVTDLTYTETGLDPGLYEYYVTAVYYFGESVGSSPTYALVVGIDELDATRLQIFPNPASEMVTINSAVEITSIQVMNNAGQVVLTKKVNTRNYQLNVSKLERGVYYIKLDTKDGKALRKIAVE